jgi:hypothetical protein
LDEIMFAAAVIAAKVVGEQLLSMLVTRALGQTGGTVLRLTLGGAAGVLLELERTAP